MNGLLFRDGTPAKMAPGKYQTRNMRIAEITGSHVETGETNGRPWSKTIYDGNLLMSDCRTVDTRATWSDDGHYLHMEGVQSPFDLCLVVSQQLQQEPEPVGYSAPPADPAILQQTLMYAAISKKLDPLRQGAETDLDTVTRLIAEYWECADMKQRIKSLDEQMAGIVVPPSSETY